MWCPNCASSGIGVYDRDRNGRALYCCPDCGWKDTTGYGAYAPLMPLPPDHKDRCRFCGYLNLGHQAATSWLEPPPGVCGRCGKKRGGQRQPVARARQKPQRSTSPHAADRGGDACSGLVENVRWFYGVTSGDAKAFLLSAPVDKGEYSKTITELQEGQFCVLHFKVVQVQSGGQHAKVVEILNRPDKPSGWVFTFDDGHDRMAQGFLRLNGTYAYEKTVDVAWYRPGAWNKVRLEYCRDGRLRAAVNGILLERMITRNTGVVPITTRAYGLDVVFDG